MVDQDEPAVDNLQLATSMLDCLLHVAQAGCFVAWVTSSSFDLDAPANTVALVPVGLRSDTSKQPLAGLLSMQGSRWCAPEVLNTQIVSCTSLTASYLSSSRLLL